MRKDLVRSGRDGEEGGSKLTSYSYLVIKHGYEHFNKLFFLGWWSYTREKLTGSFTLECDDAEENKTRRNETGRMDCAVQIYCCHLI